MATKKCPVCGVSVKLENLARHVKNQHPHAKVEGLKEARAARKKSPRAWRDDLTRIGTVVTVATLVWIVIAVLFPVPVGIAVPVSPDLVILALVGVALLATGWVLGSGVLARSGKKLATAGLVVGLALAGAAALVARQQGVPGLSTHTTSQPGGWTKADNAVWRIDGLPVVFYHGSAACPFCAASSWAVWGALKQFGTLGGCGFTTSMSSPNEQWRNVPEVDMAHASLASAYLTLDVKAGNDNQQITTPSLSATEQAYVVTYNSQGGIPFYIVGGIYFHATLVDPAIFFPSGQNGPPMTPQEVEQTLASGSGSVYQAVHQAQVYVEAYLVKVCEAAGIAPPSAVAQDPAVAAIVAQIK